MSSKDFAPKNSAGHDVLLSAAANQSVEPDRVRTLLWLVNAPPELSELRIVLGNLTEVLSAAGKQWPDLLSLQGLEWIPGCIKQLSPIVRSIQQKLDSDAETYPRDWRDRNALYCALRCDLSRSQSLRRSYQLLQAHFFFAHRAVLNRNLGNGLKSTDIASYESYGGKGEWPAFTIRPYHAGLCIRDMSEQRNSNWASEFLEMFPVIREPRILATHENVILSTETVNVLKKSHGFDAQKKVNYISDYLRQAYGFSQRGTGGGSSRRQSVQSDIGDPDDPWLNFGILSDWEMDLDDVGEVDPLVLSGIPEDSTVQPPTQPEEPGGSSEGSNRAEDANMADDHNVDSDELDDEDNIDVYGGSLECEDPEYQNSPGSFDGRAIGTVNKLLRTQKMFRFGIERLSAQELYGLGSAGILRLHLLLRDRKHLRTKPHKVHQRAECISLNGFAEAETLLFLMVMLWTGSDERRTRSLTLCMRKELAEKITSFSVYADPQSRAGSSFRLEVPFPKYKKDQPEAPGDCARSSYIVLPDIVHLYSAIHSFSKISGLSDSRIHNVFRKNVEFYKKNARAMLEAWDPSGRLTLWKISSAIFGGVMSETGNDAVAATIITGSSHRLSRVPLYYACRHAEQLKEIHSSAVRNLKYEIDQGELLQGITLESVTAEETSIEDRIRLRPKTIGAKPETAFIGSRLCPQVNTVRDAVLRLKKSLHKPHAETANTAWVKFHNLYTFYTLWAFAMATGVRKMITPYVAVSEVSPLNHVAILRDKDNDAGSKAKLIWVPDTIYGQMRHYADHLEYIKARFGVKDKYLSLPCFFLSKRGSPLLVRPKSQSEYTSRLLPKFPFDVHRRFMYNALLNHGCPPEVTRVWMGHACVGEEWWSEHATLSHQTYRHYLKEYLVPILDYLGFTPVKGAALPDQSKGVPLRG